VFLVAVPIAALAFLATWLIPQVELKQWPEASETSPDALSTDVGAPETKMTMASVAAAPQAQGQEGASSTDTSQAVFSPSRAGDLT
jgi:hypothetical protein